MSLSLLFVDDNLLLAGVAVSALDAVGVKAHPACNAREALALLEREKFDAVVIDVMLPGESDGLQLLQTIRESQPDMPAIVTTGYDREYLDLPADVVVIEKPYLLTDLAAALFGPTSELDCSTASPGSGPVEQL